MRTGVLVVALAVRLVPMLVADRVTADVLRYRKVAAHVLDASWNPYTAPRLYPYPPLWVWAEAGSEWVSRRTGWSFAFLVKLPILAADLAIVALLARFGRAAWLYALHPVSVLVTGFHGQFDAVMLFFLLLALFAFEHGRPDGSALALAGAIATKSVPLLLLPFFLARLATWRARARFLALATLPVALLLLPYALADLGALRRELLGYGGIADFGWIGLVRGLRWLREGVLVRSEAVHWPLLVAVGKGLFLAALAALLARPKRLSLVSSALAVFLAFLVLYGAVSAQYLLWVVPLGLLSSDRWSALHAVAATLALFGFYPFLAPGLLFPGESLAAAGGLWVTGVAAVLAVDLAWFVTLLRR